MSISKIWGFTLFGLGLLFALRGLVVIYNYLTFESQVKRFFEAAGITENSIRGMEYVAAFQPSGLNGMFLLGLGAVLLFLGTILLNRAAKPST
jgi:hypothetical protein